MPRTVFAAPITGVVLVLALASPASGAGLADPYLSFDVSCTPDSSGDFVAPPLPIAHPGSFTRFTSTGAGSGDWKVDSASRQAPNIYFSPGDQGFGFTDRTLETTGFNANDSVRASLRCADAPASGHFDLYDIPTAPVSYPAGQLSPRRFGAFDKYYFNAPTPAKFVVDLAVSQGAVTIDGAATVGTATIPLGERQGQIEFAVQALDGPPARYQASVRALPVAVAGLAVPGLLKPGTSTTARYTVDGPTTVSASIVDQGGVVQRGFTPFAAQAGSREFTFAAAGDGGAKLADGTFRLVVSSTDAYGGTSSASAPVIIDGTAPSLTLPAAIKADSSLPVTVKDANGTRAIAVDRQPIASGATKTVANETTLVRRVAPPSGGWRTGSRVYVRAVDGAGNITDTSRRVVVAPAATQRLSLARVRARGLSIAGKPGQAKSVTVRLRVSKTVQRSLKLRSPVLATRRVKTQASKAYTVRIKLSSRVRSALKRRSSTTITIDPSSGSTQPKRVVIRR